MKYIRFFFRKFGKKEEKWKGLDDYNMKKEENRKEKNILFKELVKLCLGISE